MAAQQWQQEQEKNLEKDFKKIKKLKGREEKEVLAKNLKDQDCTTRGGKKREFFLF